MDRVIEIFYNKLAESFPLDVDVRLIWEEVKEYAKENPALFKSEKSKYMWFLDEIIERYNMTAYEIDELGWLFEFSQREDNNQPPNG